MTERSWLELLPEPWRDNPDVVVVMAPVTARSCISEKTDGSATFGTLKIGNRIFGLQVLDPKVPSYAETEQRFAAEEVNMLPPAYIGKLHDIPQRLLINDDRMPLCFMAEAMWRPYLNIRGVAKANPAGGEPN